MVTDRILLLSTEVLAWLHMESYYSWQNYSHNKMCKAQPRISSIIHNSLKVQPFSGFYELQCCIPLRVGKHTIVFLSIDNSIKNMTTVSFFTSQKKYFFKTIVACGFCVKTDLIRNRKGKFGIFMPDQNFLMANLHHFCFAY